MMAPMGTRRVALLVIDMQVGSFLEPGSDPDLGGVVTRLEALLKDARISELFIAGSATDFCVDTTVRAALSLDFEVTVVRDGHLTRDRDHLDAKSIIAQAHYVWEELLHPHRRIRVVAAEAIIEELCAGDAPANHPDRQEGS